MSGPRDAAFDVHVIHYFPGYVQPGQFETLATNRDWLRANRSPAVRFLRAVHVATKYAYAHRAEAVAALTSSIKIDADVAARTYDVDYKQRHR